MTQPPVTVPQVRSTLFPAGKPLTVATAVAPTMAGLSYVSSIVTSCWPAAGAAARAAVDFASEHAVNATANPAAMHRAQRGGRLMYARIVRRLWNDCELRGLHLEWLELT